jgi:predicted aldo/keto reductase-like oxidoreductase
MKKIELGKTGLLVSPIGFGVLTIGENQLNLPISEGAAIVRYGLECGINFLDTAQYYRTYLYIREALKGSGFDPVISSKSLDLSANDMAIAIEEARKELDRDIIDIFLLHEVRNDPDFSNRAGAWEQLQEAKIKGLVKAIGVSTHHVDVAEKMVDIEECDVLFPLINIESLGIRLGTGFGTKEDMAAAIQKNSKRGKGIFAMKAFGGGNLVRDYVTCLDYVTSLPGISSVMLGFGTCDEVDRAIEYAEGILPSGYVPDVSNKKIYIDPGDCEGCGSCLVRCPNHAITINLKGVAEVNSEICLTCGYCAPVCPTRAIILC